MKRLVTELVRLGDNKGIYRSSDSDSIEQIGGLTPTQIPKRASTKLYSDEQLETALDLMMYNSLAELGKQDFSVFGKKQSWVQLATGCVQRLAADLLLLTDIRTTIKRCDLLHNRFETRRAAKIRTPNQTQSNIQTLNLLRTYLRDIHHLSTGRDVLDIERAIGRAQTVMNTWRSASSLVPTVNPRTDALLEMVKLAMANVLNGSARDNVKSAARRVLVQFSSGGAKLAGEQVIWDSD